MLRIINLSNVNNEKNEIRVNNEIGESNANSMRHFDYLS
jgi:hypothetical protein